MPYRLASLILLLVAWAAASAALGPRLLPGPQAVAGALVEITLSGALAAALAASLGRVAAAFLLAMSLGSALGYAMGRRAALDELIDPWIVLLLNCPALVVIILAYVWFGLTEAAAVGAAAVNKLPNTVVVVREGARVLDPGLDDMAAVFRFGAARRLRHVVLPQLAPTLAAAGRSGLSLVWKIVLVVELLGRPNGVGFELNTAFQLFDVTLILAYGLSFVAVMMLIELVILQPLERHVGRWRARA